MPAPKLPPRESTSRFLYRPVDDGSRAWVRLDRDAPPGSPERFIVVKTANLPLLKALTTRPRPQPPESVPELKPLLPAVALSITASAQRRGGTYKRL